jgi:hypothetical protein
MEIEGECGKTGDVVSLSLGVRTHTHTHNEREGCTSKVVELSR